MDETTDGVLRAAPYVLAPGERVSDEWDFQPEMRMLASGIQTANALTVADCSYDASRFGPPLHIHENDDEAMFILEGVVTVQLGDERYELHPGSFAWMPRNVPHAFANLSGAPIRVFGLSAPSGFEHMLSAIGAALSGETDPTRVWQIYTEIGEKYGFRVIGPPITDDPAMDHA